MTRYRTLAVGAARFAGILAVLGVLVAVGLAAAHHMDVEGHHVSGMSNQVVWGVPHVFAVFLIVAASGALNAASLASVLGRPEYRPLSRLSGLVAIALLVGGLAVLVLDLGRPDRLIVAMTTYNFKSIFAWNIFLYTGFVAVVGVYLALLFQPRLKQWSRRGGMAALVWRIVLTTGTGSIFGFLVAREAYDAAVMAPLFVAMSLSFGTATFILVTVALASLEGSTVAIELRARLGGLLRLFVLAVLYLTVVQHLTNLYATGHHEVEAFLLRDGGIYPWLFWGGQVLLGTVAPVALLGLRRLREDTRALVASALLVVSGAFAQVYVIIIGGQAYPLELLPGMEVRSTFFDGVIGAYTPSLPEVALGVGGLALALGLVLVAVRVLPALPERYALET